MDKFRLLSRICLTLCTIPLTSTVFAATEINLNQQTGKSLLPIVSDDPKAQIHFQEKNSSTDFNQTKHTRFQEMYAGYPIWGADIVLHQSQNIADSASGFIYKDIMNDLATTPQYALNTPQVDKLTQTAVFDYQKKHGPNNTLKTKYQKRIVYIDKSKQAHWAYVIQLTATYQHMPALPTYIMDATTMEIYHQWDDIQTMENVAGGGFGGNEKSGKISYDGLKNDYAKLDIQRDTKSKTCYLSNSEVTVKDVNHNQKIAEFPCKSLDKKHNSVYWDADFDTVNGGYSPSNDALAIGKVIKNMYQDWFKVPVLTENGKPMMLNMVVHEPIDNAYWDGQQMTFGDGVSYFYPLVSIDVGAHEISHGFTSQHSDLVYDAQSGGLNESFSDMAAQAAEYYVLKKNSWMIGDTIVKEKDKALRYMDEPTKDCGSNKPGDGCSISNVKDYSEYLDVHYSSGIYNKVFYLMSTGKGWNTKKAFEVMVKANQDYWTSTSDFNQAACGVLKATKDYKYTVAAVNKAFKTVGISTTSC